MKNPRFTFNPQSHSSSQSTQSEELGQALYDTITQLYPLHRSITGDGVRDTLRLIDQQAQPAHVDVYEVPTGTQVFDWTVPQEWNIRDAFIKDATGRRLIDYHASNLHIVNYSLPLHQHMTWDALKEHVYSLPDQPDWIPYRTGYFRDMWGFCVSQRQYEMLEQHTAEPLEVCIDATLKDGSLTYGEIYLPGESPDEILLAAHICHPSLANDNLSGIAIATFLAQYLATQQRRYSYRFIFVPATIGAITWLSQNKPHLDRIKHGLVLALLGDPGQTTYKKSRRGNAPIDRVMDHVLRHAGSDYTIVDFEPFGYDERQFCSPGINLPMGCLMRTPNGQYPEYHTSADNLDLVKPAALADSWEKCLAVIDVLEHNYVVRNLKPDGEPQLGRHGLYQAYSERHNNADLQRAVLWVLNFADGTRDLLAIAERSGLSFSLVRDAAALLVEHELLAVQATPCSTMSPRPSPGSSSDPLSQSSASINEPMTPQEAVL